MRILIIAHSSKLSGGANRSLLSVIDCFKNNGSEVEVILPKKSGKMYQELSERNVKTHYIAYGQIYGGVKREENFLFKKLIINFKLIHDYVKSYIFSFSLRKKSYDIVYTNTSLPFFGAFLAKHLNIPHVWHCREFIYPETDILPKNIFQLMSKLSRKVIVISTEMKQKFMSIGEDKLVLIHNGIESNKMEVFKQKHSGFNLIQVARIVESKRQEDAIEAINLLNKKGITDIYLYFAGQPESDKSSYYRHLKEMIKFYNLQDKVIFCGEIKDLSNLRSQMDVELMCSVAEAFGRVTIEAMRNKLLVIGTSSGGTLDIIENNVTGLLYPPCDYEKLADCIEFAYYNREKINKISEKGYIFSQTNFTEKQFVEIYELLKKEVIK